MVCPLLLMSKRFSIDSTKWVIRTKISDCIESDCAFYVHSIVMNEETESSEWSECAVLIIARGINNIGNAIRDRNERRK